MVMNKMIKPEPEAMELEETQPGVIEPAWTTEEAKDMSVETHQDTFWPDNQLGLKDYVAPDNPGSPFVSDTPMQLGTPTRSVETEKTNDVPMQSPVKTPVQSSVKTPPPKEKPMVKQPENISDLDTLDQRAEGAAHSETPTSPSVTPESLGQKFDAAAAEEQPDGSAQPSPRKESLPAPAHPKVSLAKESIPAAAPAGESANTDLEALEGGLDGPVEACYLTTSNPPPVLTRAAIYARLWRVFQRRKDGSHQVDKQWVEMWADHGNGRQQLESMFEKVGYNVDRGLKKHTVYLSNTLSS